jgi:hypothetical protein
VTPDPVPFSGSYDPADVTFLLKPVALAPTQVAEKERLIQAGHHYSEMIAPEHPPTPDYLALYHAALARNGARLAADVSTLAARLAEATGGREVVVASLARAGTPIGVLLRRALAARGVATAHYSLSIIRGRGIDSHALAHIAARHDPAHVVFIDGWTGKGAIADELERSLAGRPMGFAPRLGVVADPAGRATWAASTDDYLIASGLLNAVVSGLVSRSILSRETVGPGDFHACVFYREWWPQDLSRGFVDALTPAVLAAKSEPDPDHARRAPALRTASAATVAAVAQAAGVADRNRIKPGIAEATRALLRRVPDRLFLRNAADPDVAHLVHLARERGVPVEPLDPASRYRAVAVIAAVGE